MVENVEVVIPELILYEESYLRLYEFQEPAGIGDSIDRQVADNVGTLIVLSHLISRGREEGEQNLIFGTVLTQILYDRAALFELAQRCCMNPDILCIGIHLLAQHSERISFSAPHLLHLFVEDTCDCNSQLHYVHYDVIHNKNLN